MVRVRFAPSPTGPLHIGGVRTALYNYLFAKKMGGKFILRIEDTDRNRFVPGAEEYIIEALNWFGLETDEDPVKGGPFGPYRQSERKELYKQYALKMLEDGNAYYAFDSAEDLERMREEAKENGKHVAKYDASVRMQMKNSLSLSVEETESLLTKGENIVMRLKIPADRRIGFEDVVRNDVSFDSKELDDKVILKGDGMPTYHLANIVDDHLMEITHVIRGEEWLSSTAHHILMYEFMGWVPPKFVHLPLILKPVGQGKLSKRDGAKFGFPVFPLEWEGEETFSGFREDGFDSDAVKNFLAFLGWNPGTEQEIFSSSELIESFSLEKIVKAGARFDIDKARWYNQQYIIAKDNSEIGEIVSPLLKNANFTYPNEAFLHGFIELMKERVESYNDFAKKGYYFFEQPIIEDEKIARKKWKDENEVHFKALEEQLRTSEEFDPDTVQNIIKTYIAENALSFGAILPILRIAISGTMKGPDIFGMMSLIGQEESIKRLRSGVQKIKTL